MPYSKNVRAYAMEMEIWEQALQSDEPKVVGGLGEQRLKDLRKRLYQARLADRLRNKELYPPDDPLHSCSVYDVLRMREGPGGKIIIYRVKEPCYES